MKIRGFLAGVVALALISTSWLGQEARAEMIQITVTNNQLSGGFAFTPVWLGLSNGTFGSFNAGSNLNGTPLEPLAELGDTGPLMTAFAGFGPQLTLGGGPFVPGASGSAFLNVVNPGTTRFLNYASMVVPSNDLFFGNPNSAPIALFNASGQLIDAGGQLTATRTISIFGAQVWDAGTEVNAINNGGAFVMGVNAMGGTPENGTAQLLFGGPTDNSAYLNSLVGVNTPAGYAISRVLTASDPIATITITAVPEPSSLTLTGLGMTIALVLTRTRRRSSRVHRA